MPLSPGDALSHYEILAPIGAGGMGEVYKARDTRLDRTVAIKVLPEHIAKREDLKARFEREARAVASLNHPHICVLYDIGEVQGTSFMVLEHLEGETLESRLQRGALPLDTALQYAMQTADALDRAHRAGVTHRDIKPANLMLTRDGVKVLDFGLAKSTAKPGPTEATIVASLTSEGTVLGTPQYMAPELFEGREADARADVWAFGAVLYEMLTGRKAFEGKSYSSLVGAILSTEPGPVAPAWLERITRRCLQKDPEDRYQSIRDVLLDLRTGGPEPERKSPTTRPWLAWALGAAGITTAAAGASGKVCSIAGASGKDGVRRNSYFAKRQHGGFHCLGWKQAESLRARARFGKGAIARRDRSGRESVLVARQPVDRLLRTREIEACGRGRWSRTDRVRRSRDSRRKLERARCDSFLRQVVHHRASVRSGR